MAYEARFPFANVPYEVINQWEDWVPPLPRTPVDDLDVFAPEELQAVADSRPVWEAAADAIGNHYPTIDFVQMLPEWDLLRQQARSAVLVLQERGHLPEDREVPTPRD